MCDECRTIAAEHLMDYANLGLHLEVAVRLERESVMRQSLQDRVGQDAIDTALQLADLVTEVGDEMRGIAEKAPAYWSWLLALRQSQVAMEAQT